MLLERGGGRGVGGGEEYALSCLSSVGGLIPKRGWVSASCQVPQVGKAAEVTHVS